MKDEKTVKENGTVSPTNLNSIVFVPVSQEAPNKRQLYTFSCTLAHANYLKINLLTKLSRSGFTIEVFNKWENWKMTASCS